ncbi:MAG: class I SAM-dependent methyltransferase [Erysipelotrichales bacterium]|nr:class I SAM-dependent methyltransferase [Erysipelotrichales bacterium]
MKNEEFIELNKKGWNELIMSNKPFANTILPEYGPFLKRNEDEIQLMPNLKNMKVLDLGCGEGESLEYLYKKGASEIWGIDISEEQIKKAQKRFPLFKDNFYVSPMEKEIDIPNNYFDYIISIFSIGYTSDLLSSLKNAYKYLKSDGSIIISWTHPFYYCLDIVDEKVIIHKSYFNEDSEIITKGPDKVNLAQKNLMISTIINTAKDAGFYVDTILEEETVLKDDVNGYKSVFWKKEKTVNCPSTLIIKFKKIIN